MTSPAVVIVSGGSAISPFTTPEAACGTGQAAGSTDTFLRAGLLEAGYAVYTSPAMAGVGTAMADPGFAGFADPPEVLPAEVTVNSVGSIDAAGASLARFLQLLAERFNHSSLHLVAHSMGGLFSLSAMTRLGSAVPHIASLTTIGTPWRGGFAADYAAGDLDLSEANSVKPFEQILTSFAEEVATLPANNAGQQVAARFVDNWMPSNAGVLDGYRVTLIAGDAFTGTDTGTDTGTGTGTERMWPNDGLVTRDSALGVGVDPAVLADTEQHTFSDAHSVFFADLFGLPWERALTWDPAVLKVVLAALARHD